MAFYYTASIRRKCPENLHLSQNLWNITFIFWSLVTGLVKENKTCATPFSIKSKSDKTKLHPIAVYVSLNVLNIKSSIKYSRGRVKGWVRIPHWGTFLQNMFPIAHLLIPNLKSGHISDGIVLYRWGFPLINLVFFLASWSYVLWPALAEDVT